MWSQAETLGKMNELVSVWYMDMPPAKHNLNKTWTLLFPILCTSTRESSNDICASFDKESMAVQQSFRSQLVLLLVCAGSLAAGLKSWSRQRRESRERKEKCSHPGDRETKFHALFRKFSGGPLLGMDEGTGGLLNSSGLGWFPRKARCHNPY